MALGFNSRSKSEDEQLDNGVVQEYTEMKEKTGFTVAFTRTPEKQIVVKVISPDVNFEHTLPATANGEARILYVQSCECLRTRGGAGQDRATIISALEGLYDAYKH